MKSEEIGILIKYRLEQAQTADRINRINRIEWPSAEGGWMNGRGTKKEREIKKIRKLENRKRNAGWINPINLINYSAQSSQ